MKFRGFELVRAGWGAVLLAAPVKPEPAAPCAAVTVGPHGDRGLARRPPADGSGARGAGRVLKGTVTGLRGDGPHVRWRNHDAADPLLDHPLRRPRPGQEPTC